MANEGAVLVFRSPISDLQIEKVAKSWGHLLLMGQNVTERGLDLSIFLR